MRVSLLLSFLCAVPFFSPTALGTSAPLPQVVTDYAAHFNQGNELIQQTRFREAIAEFREAVRINPSYLPAHQALVVGYLLTQHNDLAWYEVEAVQRLGGEVPDKIIQGLTEETSEKEAADQRQINAQKLASAQSVAELDHPNASALAEYSYALLNTGDLPAAQKQAHLALELNPREPLAQFVLATLLFNDPPTRQESLPHLKLYLQNVSRTPVSSGDIAKAYLMLGQYYSQSDKEAEALRALEDGLELEPNNVHLLNAAAWQYATSSDTSLRQPAKAVAYAQKAAALTKNQNAAILDTLGESFYVNGRYGEAMEAEQKAISLFPDNTFYADQLKKFKKAKDVGASSKP